MFYVSKLRAGRRPGLWLLLGLLAIGFMSPCFAAKKKKKRHTPALEWGLSVSAAGNYNDNLIGLSERDHNLYLRAPGAFPTPLKTADDLETELGVRPSARWRAPSKLWVNADYRFKWVHRQENAFTDYTTHSFGVSVRPRATASPWQIRARVLAIPSFYLRVYKDKDYGEYHSARFANWYYSGAFRYKVMDPLWLELQAGYGTFYYNRKFTEYDSEYHDAGVEAGYRIKNWSASAGYTRRLSDNVGKGQLGGVPAIADPQVDTEYGDADFNEDELNFGLGGDLDFITWRPVSLDLGYKWRRRVYMTDRALELDPFHRGRLDKRGQLTVTLTTDVSRHFTVDVFSGYDERRSESPNPSVPAVKNFVRHEYGVRLNYEIK